MAATCEEIHSPNYLFIIIMMLMILLFVRLWYVFGQMNVAVCVCMCVCESLIVFFFSAFLLKKALLCFCFIAVGGTNERTGGKNKQGDGQQRLLRSTLKNNLVTGNSDSSSSSSSSSESSRNANGTKDEQAKTKQKQD